MSMAPAQIAGTVLFIAPARIATLTFSAITIVLALEIARRAFRFVADQAGYTPKEGLGKHIADWTPDVVGKITSAIEPPATPEDAKAGKGLTLAQLAKALAICAVITTIGWEFSKWLSGGEISPHYNNVARFFGPLVLDTNYRHPAVQFGVDIAKRAF